MHVELQTTTQAVARVSPAIPSMYCLTSDSMNVDFAYLL